MAVFDMGSADPDRIRRLDRQSERSPTDETPARAKTGRRTFLEIGTGLLAILLIMIGAMALRALLSLSYGVAL